MLAYIAAICAGSFSYIIMIIVIRRYYKKKSHTFRILAFIVFFLATAVILDPLLFTIYRIFGLSGDAFNFAVNVQTNLSFGIAGVANAFLMVFIVQVFMEGKYPGYSYLVMIGELCILPLAISFLLAGQDTLPVLLIFLVVSITLYVLLITVASRLLHHLKKAQDVVSYEGISYLRASGYFLILTFAMFVLQEFAVQVPAFTSLGLAQGQDSIFPTIGWILTAVTTYSIYIGYLCPEWIRKRWLRRTATPGKTG